jgi:Holliday junction resolvase RusA-like endonuclease
MTRADRWKGRKVVQRYWAYKEEIQRQQEDFVFPHAGAQVRFYIRMPKSWSSKKKAEMEGQPHQRAKNKDIDNLLKALWDCLRWPEGDDDGHIWCIRGASKVWSSEPKIIISVRPAAVSTVDTSASE